MQPQGALGLRFSHSLGLSCWLGLQAHLRAALEKGPSGGRNAGLRASAPHKLVARGCPQFPALPASPEGASCCRRQRD